MIAFFYEWIFGFLTNYSVLMKDLKKYFDSLNGEIDPERVQSLMYDKNKVLCSVCKFSLIFVIILGISCSVVLRFATAKMFFTGTWNPRIYSLIRYDILNVLWGSLYSHNLYILFHIYRFPRMENWSWRILVLPGHLEFLCGVTALKL